MPTPIVITDAIAITREELEISYVRASGSGGQNVNKVSTAAQLRFDLQGSPSLSAGVKARAARIAGSRLTKGGEIVMSASRHRTQALNEQDVIDRLIDLLQRAAVPPKKRVRTRPTLASKRRRVDAKVKRGAVKKLRSQKPSASD